MSLDLRKYARQTNLRLLAGFILILFVIGDSLIYVVYGKAAAVLGLLCLLAGLLPLSLIALALWTMEKVLERSQPK